MLNPDDKESLFEILALIVEQFNYEELERASRIVFDKQTSCVLEQIERYPSLNVTEDAMLENSLIEALRLYRDRTSVSLLEAKVIMDFHRDKKREAASKRYTAAWYRRYR